MVAPSWPAVTPSDFERRRLAASRARRASRLGPPLCLNSKQCTAALCQRRRTAAHIRCAEGLQSIGAERSGLVLWASPQLGLRVAWAGPVVTPSHELHEEVQVSGRRTKLVAILEQSVRQSVSSPALICARRAGERPCAHISFSRSPKLTTPPIQRTAPHLSVNTSTEYSLSPLSDHSIMLHEGTCSEVGLAPSVQGPGAGWCLVVFTVAFCPMLPGAGLSPFVIGNQMRNQHHSTEVSSGLVASDRVHRSLVPPSMWIRRRSVLDLRLTSVFGRRFDDASSRHVSVPGPGATPRTAPRRAPHA